RDCRWKCCSRSRPWTKAGGNTCGRSAITTSGNSGSIGRWVVRFLATKVRRDELKFLLGAGRRFFSALERLESYGAEQPRRIDWPVRGIELLIVDASEVDVAEVPPDDVPP